SYYDTNIGVHNVVYTGIEETDNYDSIYQSDLCGWVGQLGFNKESIYGANVFEAEKAQKLKAAGFYATGKDTEYEVYVVRNFTDESSFERKEKVASGKLDNAGYYTIPFSKNIPVKEGERFSIVVYLKTPDAVHPMAIEYKADATTSKVDLSDGEGYISTNGSVWENVEETQECNLCIKAYAGK
ncbi:MAG: lectin like domain-containing protein, partial [Lachnospiraceae bacterium]|nr:lectin like domain-containing protein [Lachnospiraceae bacterium]